MNDENPALEGLSDYPGDPGEQISAAPARRSPPAEPRNYDFRRRTRISPDRLRVVEAQYAQVTRTLEAWLIGRIRGGVELTLHGVEEISFGEFVSSLPTPCCSYIFEITDSGGQSAVIDFGQEFAFHLVERLFGGTGSPEFPDRALTPIERMAVRSVADRVASLVRDSWQESIEIDLALTGWESLPESIEVAAREEPVLVATIQVAAADLRSNLTICLPFRVLETCFAEGGGKRSNPVIGSSRERLATRESTEALVRSTPIDVAARLPGFRLTMRDLAALKPGAVISTGIATGARIEVTVSGQTRFLGSPGRSGRNLAVRVLDTLPTGEAENLPEARPGRTGRARVTSQSLPNI